MTIRKSAGNLLLAGLVALVGCQSVSPSAPSLHGLSPSPEIRSAIWSRAAATTLARRTSARLASLQVPEPIAAPDGFSDAPAELTLADLEGIAFVYHPALAAATARIEMARGRQVQAGLWPNPVIGYHATEVGKLGTAGQQGAFVRQQFITAGKQRLDVAIAAQETAEAHFRLQLQELRVLSDVRIRFYEALAAQRRVELTQKLAQIGEELVEATRKLLDARRGTENDRLQAEIQAEQAFILRDNARNEQTEAWRRLAAVVGAPALQVTPLEGSLDADLPAYQWDRCYALVLERNPALQAARTRVQRADLTLQRARRDPIPNVDLTVSHRYHNVTRDDVTNIQVGIPIPLFDKNQGNIRRAEAAWAAARNEVLRQELELQDRLAVAFRRYKNARQQVERYGKRILPRAQESLRLVRQGYRQGQVQYLTLLTAQQTYLQVSLAHLAALRAVRVAASRLEGQLQTGSLSSP